MITLKNRYSRKSATEQAPLHDLSAKNTLDIIPNLGIIKRTI
jgi:hypothetical protein